MFSKHYVCIVVQLSFLLNANEGVGIIIGIHMYFVLKACLLIIFNEKLYVLSLFCIYIANGMNEHVW